MYPNRGLAYSDERAKSQVLEVSHVLISDHVTFIRSFGELIIAQLFLITYFVWSGF